MTTLYLSEKSCFVCGTKNRYPLIDLTLKITGSRDLDGRPSYIQRSLIYLWIQHCITCNYCAPEISMGSESDLQFIKSKEYSALLSDIGFPETARSFRGHSFVMEKNEQYPDSGWAQLCAAWVCDDNGYDQGSMECRTNAHRIFLKAQSCGIQFSESRIQETVYLIDILRRTFQFNKAQEICEKELNLGSSDHYMELLEFEASLINQKDASCHNENEIEEFE